MAMKIFSSPRRAVVLLEMSGLGLLHSAELRASRISHGNHA
jgi:hypothetical protein